MFIIASPAQTIDLEESLQVQQKSEYCFNVIVLLVEDDTWLAVMFKGHGSRDNAIGQYNGHDEHAEVRGTEDGMASVRCQTALFCIIDGHQTPALVVSAQYLGGGRFLNMATSAPHLLELHTNFIESFRNHRYEHVLHQPSQEKYHRTKGQRNQREKLFIRKDEKGRKELFFNIDT